MARGVITTPLMSIPIAGNVFVLTGKMWNERAQIEKQIRGLGGSTAARVQGNEVVLVVADNATMIGPMATMKVREAEHHGARTVRESDLKRALQPSAWDSSQDAEMHADVKKKRDALHKVSEKIAREMNAQRLDVTKLDETSKLLAGF